MQCYLPQRSDISCNNVNMSTQSTLSHDQIPIKVLRAPVKFTVNALAAGCQSFYRKICGHFLQCRSVTLATTELQTGVLSTLAECYLDDVT